MEKEGTQREYRCPVAYTVQFSEEGFTKQDLKDRQMGGCNALIVISIMRDNDKAEPFEGGKSFQIASTDGRRGQEVPTAEYFQAMVHLANYVSEQPDVDPGMREVCWAIVDAHRAMIGLVKQPDGTWKSPNAEQADGK